jgi:hypothetical protein
MVLADGHLVLNDPLDGLIHAYIELGRAPRWRIREAISL